MIDRLVHRQLSGIDDAHVHADLDRMVEEHRMHGLSNRLIAAERERQVGYATRHVNVRQGLNDVAGRIDEIDAIIVMFLDAGRYREHIRIEDDILR